MVHLLKDDFEYFIKIMDNCDIYNDKPIDIYDVEFASPLLLLPLIWFSKEYNKTIGKSNNDNVNSYIDRVINFKEIRSTTYPFKEIKKNEDNSEEVTNDLYSILESPKFGATFFKFIFFELIDNIYDHSKFNNGFAFGQRYPNKDYVDFCFLDNGLGFNGSCKNSGYSFEDDCYAILESINGHSTKWKYDDDQERGTGLNTSINLIVNGNGGSIIIASGKGYISITSEGVECKKMKDEYIKGTLIGIRLNLDQQVNSATYFEKNSYYLDDKLETKKIWFENPINEGLDERSKVENLFNMLSKGNAKKVIFNFENLDYMDSNVLEEYFNQKNNANFIIEEKNFNNVY